VGPSLTLVIAQRLVRRLCDKCKKEKPITDELKAKIKNFLERLPARVNRKPYVSP
jgi:type II secretory ATPase GspE/PulE/Tfp pilus assembly ATPase PilB-like protein